MHCVSSGGMAGSDAATARHRLHNRRQRMAWTADTAIDGARYAFSRITSQAQPELLSNDEVRL